jgi:hypothetical protein
MSLDVYLEGPAISASCTCECGHQHERKRSETLYEANITHNLNKMAAASGLYEALWYPETLNATLAGQLIAPLTAGLKTLRAEPAKFEGFGAANGWGLYEHFVPFVEKYLEACKKYPDATVNVSR